MVSIVIANYNTEKYIGRCLESVCTQTYGDIEIIVINDGSTDGSINVIKAYAARDNRIRVFDIENRGVHNARNLGLEQARGEYIMFVDSDDYIADNAVSRLFTEVEVTQCDFSACNFIVMYDDFDEGCHLSMPRERVIYPQVSSQKVLREIIDGRVGIGLAVSNKLFRREFLLKTGIWFEDREEIYGEDSYFLFKILKFTHSICVVDEPLYFYYQRVGSVSRMYKRDFKRRNINYLEGIAQFYDDPSIVNQRFFWQFIEIIHNEKRNPYRDFKNAIGGEYFKKRMRSLDPSMFPNKRKIIYVLYRLRLWYLLYRTLKTFFMGD